MPGQRILLVEDEGILAMNIRITLLELGYEIVGIAASGEDAVKLARSGNPDLVIMDIKLAGQMDGIEAARKIGEDPGTPVLFVSAHTDDATYNKAMALQPVGFLEKPVEEYKWSYIIEEALKRRS